jgi:hypothetical protein
MNNPPAFPKPKLMQQAVSFDHEDGMTLRDYFAAKAMQGMVANSSYSINDWSKRDIAIQSYEMADAMMKAREA